MLAESAAALLQRGSAAELPAALDPTGPTIDPLPELRDDASDAPLVVLPVLHGPNGEDGTVQGLLELAGVPYVGSGVLGSALAMDKVKAKEVLGAHGIPQARWSAATSWEIDASTAGRVVDELGWPLFVKPANMGSSIGVAKVTGAAELADAIADALCYDDIVVFEECIDGRELEVGILGNETLRTSVIGEVVPAADFYDYEDKYVDGNADLVVPAELPGSTAAELGDIARAAYRALRCEVLARVDLFLEPEGRGLLLNEVNTFPGFTPISMFPRLWEASGTGYAALLDELVSLALARHRRRSRFTGAV